MEGEIEGEIEGEAVVSATFRVAAPATRVWGAITSPGELIQWYAPGCRWEIPELREGGVVRFFNTETDVQHAIIERCVPPAELVLRWIPDSSLPETTLVNTFTMRPLEHGTTVTISQSGYSSVPRDQRESWIDADRGAFPAIAAALAAYLE